MAFVLTIMGLAFGILLILISNPVQVIPRFFRQVRYVSTSRVYRRFTAEYPSRKPFWTLSATAAGLLLFWFVLSLFAPVADDQLLLRLVLGIGVGGLIGWRLLRRQELIIASLGVIGLYPNPKLVVAWDDLSGYLISDDGKAVALANKQGEIVEAFPIDDEMGTQEVELALMPHLRRLNWDDLVEPNLRSSAKKFIALAYGLLISGTIPPLILVFAWATNQELPNLLVGLATILAVLVPYAIFDWSQNFRLLYYSHKGHVKIAHLTSYCQRCHYRAICWDSGLQQQVKWQPGIGAIVPSYDEFQKQQQGKLKIDADVYNSCCQCLISHLKEQSLYQVELVSLKLPE